MKPHIRTKGPIFSMRLRGPHAAGRVLESIKSITCELEDLQVDIYSRMGGPAELLQGFSMRERDAADRALSDFKLALDQLRYVLWLSLEPSAWEKDSAARPQESGRQPRPREMHLAPAPPRRDSSAGDGPTSASFFDRLDVVIEAYMGRDTAAPATSKKRPKP